MRRDYLLLSALFSLLVMFVSCEVPIEVEGNTQLVVQSYFPDDEDLIVYVTESNLRSSKESSYVENAVVTLFSGEDLEFINTLQFVSHPVHPFYKSIDFQPKKGIIYMVRIEVPGFKPVTASTSIPLAVNLDAVALDTSTVIKGQAGYSEVHFDFSLTIQDPVEHENYYHLIFEQELLSQVVDKDGNTRTDTSILNTDENLFIECSTKTISISQLYDHPSFILDDKEFNGENIRINFRGHFTIDERIYDIGEFTIEMRTVSDSYYRYYLNLLNSKTPVGNFPLSFGDTYTNINNGVGVFAGYTTKFTKLQN